MTQPEPDFRHLIDALQLRHAAGRLAVTRRQQLRKVQSLIIRQSRPES